MILGYGLQPAVRYASVFLTWGLATFCYYSFSHYVHHRHFHFERHNADNEQSSHHEDRLLRILADEQSGHEEHSGEHEDHQHGRRGDFDSFDHSKDKLFFYGLALPLALLTAAGLVWTGGNSTPVAGIAGISAQDTHDKAAEKGFIGKVRRWASRKNKGDVNVTKWTLIWFLLPLLVIMLEGARGHNVLHPTEDQVRRGSSLYVRICMSLMSVSGYGATWALAFFLIPVTKHSSILDWVHVTPVQALAFHRIAGWTSFACSVLHGFLHLRHLMDVLNPQRERTKLEQLKMLLVPQNSWKCFLTQNPWHVFMGYHDSYAGTDREADQCWLALVNATGMVSTVAFSLLAVTSLPSFRRKFYTLFYMVHIPTAWIMLFNAIWHYPTCGLILIPNIIYYLSFNIPVYTMQSVERWGLWRHPKNSASKAKESSSLVEVNLIQGGPIELTFATTPDNRRHENCFVRVFCPEASPVSHPFSTFSRSVLFGSEDSSLLATNSILLRSKGPFTGGVKKALFPNRVSDSPSGPTADGDAECLGSPIPDPQAGPLPPPSHHNIQFDSYYAGSFDWVDRALASHDRIMILAGGVGIVPFLEFLPALYSRIQDFGENSLEELDAPAHQVGPNRIYLHWYCREIGLASYVWHKYLAPHVREAWENDPVCKGRLKIHLHLTSLNALPSLAGEEVLANVPNSGMVEKRTYSIGDDHEGVVCPVQDARFTQSLGLRLMPGFLMATGTILHWWWYEQFVVETRFRHNNLVIRSHSVIFSLVLAVTISFLVELYFRRRENASKGYTVLGQKGGQDQEESVVELTKSGGVKILETAVPMKAKINLFGSMNNYESTTSSSSSASSMESGGSSNNMKSTSTDILKVTGGRPSIDSVIEEILKAKQPGVYSCGARSLIDVVEGSIRRKRDDCAFYQEDSEM